MVGVVESGGDEVEGRGYTNVSALPSICFCLSRICSIILLVLLRNIISLCNFS